VTVVSQKDLTEKASVTAFSPTVESYYELDVLLIVAHVAIPAHLMRSKDRFKYGSISNQIDLTTKSSWVNIKRQIPSPFHLQTNT
jgi:hypothetical protein